MEILGIIAIAFGASAYVWKGPRQIMMLSAVASTTWVFYFLTLGQWGPAFVTFTFIIVLLAGVSASNRTMRLLVVGREAVIIPFILMTMSGIPMVLVLCGGLTKGLSPLLRDRPYLYRLSVASGEALWLAFGLIEGAHSTVAWSVIAISVSLGSGAYYAWREYKAPPEVIASAA
jgi:hypothetical protein